MQFPRLLPLIACGFLLAGCAAAPTRTSQAPAPAPPRVLMLLADGYNSNEFWPTYFGLRGAGYRVDVAAPELKELHGGGPSSTFQPTLTLAQVQPADYIGLVVTGGGSPAKLAQAPQSLTICQYFFQHGRPIAGICHGPRLFADAGQLQGRICTGLYSLKDELPELWHAGRFGTYLDQPVVVDGNLVTSRFPLDAPLFVRATLENLARGGGLPTRDTYARLLVINPVTGNDNRWALIDALSALGVEVNALREWQLAAVAQEKRLEDNYDALLILDGAELDGLVRDPATTQILTTFQTAHRPILALPAVAATLAGRPLTALDNSGFEALPQVQRLLQQAARPRPVKNVAAEPNAFLLLHPGFDDKVYAAVDAHLKLRGLTVRILAPAPGFVRGLAGTPVWAEGHYADLATPRPGQVVVGVGGLWPTGPKDQTEVVRLQTFQHAYRNGATLLLFGFDALALGQDESFKGRKFATSEQACWSFGKGATYSPDPALLSADRLITAQGYAAITPALRLFDQAYSARPDPSRAP